MKPIELTEEHKSKLLEMCNKLFPEYDFTLDKWKQCFVTLGLKSKVAYDSHIHWFEFCMTYLCDKLKSLNGFNDYDDYDCDTSLMSCWFESHPVDYLYEKFKKLK
jgi:hypothetical protein